uniref:Uncharacterized protein n=1 Tax=Brugia malayi TaxID=6279 RepID=A8PPJ5_BRUMA
MKPEEQTRGKVQANLREPQLTSFQQMPRTNKSGPLSFHPEYYFTDKRLLRPDCSLVQIVTLRSTFLICSDYDGIS